MKKSFGDILDSGRTAIVFTANTPHLAHANLMIDSLYDYQKGNFKGDLWVISTGLSQRAKNFCDSKNIKYLINNLSYLSNWNKWKLIAKAQPEYKEKNKNEEENLIGCFDLFKNKRMSKLIILDWIEKFGDQYDYIALCDNDLYFQKDIHTLFQEHYSCADKCIHYAQEEVSFLPGSWLWNKDFHYACMHDDSELNWGNHEINIGFIFGKPNIIYDLFQAVKDDFFKLNIDLFTKYNWHDQDLVRLERAKNPDMFSLLSPGEIVHLCAGGDAYIEEKLPMEFYYTPLDKKPYIVHFAGGLWNKYSSIKSTYLINPDAYYFREELEASYDLIRKGSYIELFDETNDTYYTIDNKQSRIEARNKWITKKESNNHKFLFIGWLQTATHKSSVDILSGLFENDKIDLAVLNGNVTNQKYDFLCEDFPKIIAELSRITRDPLLIRTFGYELPNVPNSLFEDTIVSAMEEYQCSRKTAQALANICYFYFSDAISFYHPELVLLWGFMSPWGKMINNICKWKKIPIASLEWGILPGTVSFDFCGHMGESWVARYSDYFNSLSITGNDVLNAKEYISKACNPNLSRNVNRPMDECEIDLILSQKNQGKKCILYIESNSAHSGNTYSDEERSKYHSPFFRDDGDSYEYITEICKKRNDCFIVYKPHPISLSRGLKTKINPDNTVVVSKGSLDEVIKYADVSVTILSQGAYVSLLHGVPVVLLGTIQLNDSGSVYIPSDCKDIERQLFKAIEKGITSVQSDCFINHVARSLKYYLFKTDSIDDKTGSKELVDKLCDIVEGNASAHYCYEVGAYNDMTDDRKKCTNPIVSIIMPVYNSEEFLATCINSIISQSFTEWELICVNNGSTDKSSCILDYYANLDCRIKVHNIPEPNQRIARNLGLDNSYGKYIYFMDSDDYLDSNALEELVSTADENNSDVLYFFFREVRTDPKAVLTRPRFYEYRRFFPNENVFGLNKSLYKFFIQYPFPWAKLIKRELLIDNEIYFDLDCANFDDNPHNLLVLLNAKNPYVINRQFYNFRIHNRSMTQSINPRIKAMVDAVRIMNTIYHDYGMYQEFQKWYVPYKAHLISWAWTFLPEEYLYEYYVASKQLFDKSDINYLLDDKVWSFYEMPSSSQIQFIKEILFDSNFVSKHIKPNTTIDNKYKSADEKTITNENPRQELMPWEKISKPHLYAIKVCEKLHIIKYAIKIKKYLKKS